MTVVQCKTLPTAGCFGICSYRRLSNLATCLILSTYILQRQGKKSLCQYLHALQSLHTQSAVSGRSLGSLLSTSVVVGCSESDMPGLTDSRPSGLSERLFRYVPVKISWHLRYGDSADGDVLRRDFLHRIHYCECLQTTSIGHTSHTCKLSLP